MSEYYKSLISDDEVIKELIKESKKREGKLPTETTRLKPNLNFFQRTVSSLVSTNTRIDKSQDSFKTEYLKDNVENPETTDNSPKCPSKKADVDYAFEREMVLQTKINFVQSSDAFGSSLGSRAKKKIEIKKISFGSKSVVTPSIGIGINVTNNKQSNKHILNQKLGSISSNSGHTSSEDLILLLGSEKTTCKTVSTKHDTSKFKNKRKKLETDDVICISSDDDSLEVLSSSSEDNTIKNQMKTKVKKRRKKPIDHSDEERKKKAKRKKHKKKKKS